MGLRGLDRPVRPVPVRPQALDQARVSEAAERRPRRAHGDAEFLRDQGGRGRSVRPEELEDPTVVFRQACRPLAAVGGRCRPLAAVGGKGTAENGSARWKTNLVPMGTRSYPNSTPASAHVSRIRGIPVPYASMSLDLCSVVTMRSFLERGVVDSGDVVGGVLPLDEPARVGDFDRVGEDVDLDARTRGPVSVRKRIEEHLAYGGGRKLGNLLARADPVNDDLPPRIDKDVALRSADEMEERSLLLDDVEDLRPGVRCQDAHLERGGPGGGDRRGPRPRS